VPSEDVADLYLDLLKKCLTRYGFGHSDWVRAGPPETAWKSLIYRQVEKRTNRAIGYRQVAFDPAVREVGKDWPSEAETMIGLKRLDNIQDCVTDVLRRGVSGDLIEAGVWRGGATILMRAVLKAYGSVDRLVWVADSFQGLPEPDADRYPADAGDVHHTHSDVLSVSQEQVEENFRRYGLLDEQVRFLPGWFKDTLPTAPIEKVAVMRLDGDMYESTIVPLEALYPKLAIGGYLIVDDYGNRHTAGCKAAVDEYRHANGITESIEMIDWTGAYWRREH
jgi:O-methyltransferase